MTTARLRVDWPACDGRGLCHELLPEIVDLDPWGYPVIGGEVTEQLLDAAREAVSACPRRALRLQKS
jgi:ferredoxin